MLVVLTVLRNPLGLPPSATWTSFPCGLSKPARSPAFDQVVVNPASWAGAAAPNRRQAASAGRNDPFFLEPEPTPELNPSTSMARDPQRDLRQADEQDMGFSMSHCTCNANSFALCSVNLRRTVWFLSADRSA